MLCLETASNRSVMTTQQARPWNGGAKPPISTQCRNLLSILKAGKAILKKKKKRNEDIQTRAWDVMKQDLQNTEGLTVWARS